MFAFLLMNTQFLKSYASVTDFQRALCHNSNFQKRNFYVICRHRYIDMYVLVHIVQVLVNHKAYLRSYSEMLFCFNP